MTTDAVSFRPFNIAEFVQLMLPLLHQRVFRTEPPRVFRRPVYVSAAEW